MDRVGYSAGKWKKRNFLEAAEASSGGWKEEYWFGDCDLKWIVEGNYDHSRTEHAGSPGKEEVLGASSCIVSCVRATGTLVIAGALKKCIKEAWVLGNGASCIAGRSRIERVHVCTDKSWDVGANLCVHNTHQLWAPDPSLFFCPTGQRSSQPLQNVYHPFIPGHIFFQHLLLLSSA